MRLGRIRILGLIIVVLVFVFRVEILYCHEKTIAVIVAFPASEKKLKTLKEAGEIEGARIIPKYVGRLAGSVTELMKHIGNFSLPHADIYIFDIPSIEVRNLLRPYLENLLRGKEFYILNDPPFGTSEDMAKRLNQYYESGGRKNFRNMFRLLLGRDADPPVILPKAGFYSPKVGVLERLPQKFLNETEVVILFHRADLEGDNTKIIDSLIDELHKLNVTSFGFYYPEFDGLISHVDKLLINGTPVPRLLVNFRLMYFKPDAEKEAFELLGIPVFGAIIYRGDLSEWEKSAQGLPITLLPFYYILPETFGIVDPTVVGYEKGEKLPIERMVKNYADRIKKFLDLIRKSNNEKYIAIIYYNYPPGEGNILASNLNVVRSLMKFLGEAKRRGYDTEEVTEELLRERMLEAIGIFYGKKIREYSCISLDEYTDWYRQLPEKVRHQIESVWGPPEKDPFISGNCFKIPEIKIGKISLFPLPPRGEVQESARDLYHSTKVPPGHYYLAFYLYLQKHFDALIHFGTHGTQEWTPGKERGLDVWDFPYLTLGNLPVFYPYIVDNIGEALQAKRRGRATIVSHQTPAFAPSGTYGVLEELHQLLHKERETEGRLKIKLRDDIAEIALREKIASDLGYRTKSEILNDFEAFANKLHDYIHELARESIPLGLHTFGETKERELILLTILQILGEEWLRRWDIGEPEEFMARPLEEIKNSMPFLVLKRCIEDSGFNDYCHQVNELYQRFSAEVELDALFSALEGRYIRTSLGGDPIKTPESLPTGRNLYGFDPTRVPTETAWRVAVELTNEWLSKYVQENGEYPRKVAFSLWSTETMRHRGIVEAQILYLVGVRPVWDQWGRVVGIEIIPREVLGRPRIDVVISATGLYRDHFPNLIHLINRAIRLVAELNEDRNYVMEETKRLSKIFEEKGNPPDRAYRLATIRVFSNEAGAYGTGLDEAVFRTRDRKILTNIYLQRMGYAYDEGLHGEKIESLYEENLKGVEAVILSRSSNLYGLATTDDPFQYLGGLAMAVEELSGRQPRVLIANLRGSGKIEEADKFLLREVRSRYLNPEYLKAMMKEGASGVSQILDILNNLYGWQVVSPQVVREYIWEELKEVLLEDKYRLGLSEWFKLNPSAYAQIRERILRGLEVVGKYDLAGFGLEMSGSGIKRTSETNLKSEMLSVKGQIMKPIPNIYEYEYSKQEQYLKIDFVLLLYLVLVYSLGFIVTFRKSVYV